MNRQKDKVIQIMNGYYPRISLTKRIVRVADTQIESCREDTILGANMTQVWDFLRSVSVHFGSASQNVLKLI